MGVLNGGDKIILLLWVQDICGRKSIHYRRDGVSIVRFCTLVDKMGTNGSHQHYLVTMKVCKELVN